MNANDLVEHHLQQLTITTANFEPGDESTPVAHAFAAVGAINRAISLSPTDADATPSGPTMALALGGSDLVDKLQKWLEGP